MKKIISFAIAAIMLLSVFGAINFAAPVKASAESTNLALNKPVDEELGDGVDSWSNNGMWGIENINDGNDLSTYVHGETETHGWYIVKNDFEGDMDTSAIIDLQSVYDVCRILVEPEFHFLGMKFPNTYDVYVSADGSNWTKVFSEAGRSGYMTHGRLIEFEAIPTRYVKVTVIRGNDIVPDDGVDNNQFAGIGEIKVYDTYVSGNVAKDKTCKEYLDPTEQAGGITTSFSVDFNGLWRDDALTGGGATYEFGKNAYNMLGWIVVAQQEEATIKAIIDLHNVYTINKINLLPMAWTDSAETGDNGWFMPNTYDILVSEDGETWTTVYHGENESAAGTSGAAKEITFSAINAQYVVLDVLKGTDHRSKGDFWTGLGEIEVYGELKKAAPPVIEGLRDFDKEKGDALSYDTIFVNDVNVAEGNDETTGVPAVKQLIDGSKGDVNTIAMRGWFGNKNSEIESYGYQIDDGEPIYGDFVVDEGDNDNIIAAGGESRFVVKVDVSGMTDGRTHTIRVVAKLKNGEIVKLNRNDKDRDVFVNYKAQLVERPPVTPTGDVSIAVFVVAACAIALVVLKKKVF
ncbi:MAG: discoidin domain-containing protein [Clostridia bacterium]|nr:discoidin domain-containing protein [Clostridia bacterium]